AKTSTSGRCRRESRMSEFSTGSGGGAATKQQAQHQQDEEQHGGHGEEERERREEGGRASMAVLVVMIVICPLSARLLLGHLRAVLVVGVAVRGIERGLQAHVSLAGKGE